MIYMDMCGSLQAAAKSQDADPPEGSAKACCHILPATIRVEDQYQLYLEDFIIGKDNLRLTAAL